MKPLEKTGVELRQEVLKKILNDLSVHPRFSYLMQSSKYLKTFNVTSRQPPSLITRWHSLSVDWKSPVSSVWKAIWYVSDSVSDYEYRELKGLVLELDKDYDGEVINLPIGKTLRETMKNKVKEP